MKYEEVATYIRSEVERQDELLSQRITIGDKINLHREIVRALLEEYEAAKAAPSKILHAIQGDINNAIKEKLQCADNEQVTRLNGVIDGMLYVKATVQGVVGCKPEPGGEISK